MKIENRCLAVAIVCFIALLFFLWNVRLVAARDIDGRYANAPNHEWYESQYNSNGQWCCNEADGHTYDGDYTINKDGSVTLQDNGAPYRVEPDKVLTGPNPTGHPVWWYVSGPNGKTTFCFSPGAGI